MSNDGNLTEAQKLLLQKYPNLPEDDPLVELASWNALLEKKIDDFGGSLNSWTQAILKQIDLATNQNQLIVSQNLVLRQTGETNESLGQALLQWKQTLRELQKEFKLLKNAISRQGDTLQSLSDKSQHLSQKLDDLSLRLKSLEILNMQVNNLTKNLKTLTTRVNELTQNSNADRWFTYSGLGFLLFLVLGLHFGLMQWGKGLQSQIEDVSGTVNETLICLVRLEDCQAAKGNAP